MSLRTCLARSLVKGFVWLVLIVSAAVVANTLTVSKQGALPAGVVECWNPHTAQIFVVQGTCPTYAR